MTNEEVMRQYIAAQVGKGYIYGATGWVCTPKRREQQAKQYPDQANTILTTGARWDGIVCFDCAQLTRRAMEQIGLRPPSGAKSQFASDREYEQAGEISGLPAGRLAQLFRRRTDGSVPHTGWAIGDGTAVDARGTDVGVVRRPVGSYPWTHYKLIRGAVEEYAGPKIEKPKAESKPEPEQDPSAAEGHDGMAVVLRNVRMRKSMDTGGSSNVIIQLTPGETVELLGPVIRRDGNSWVYVQISRGKYTYRGHVVAEDTGTRYLQLPWMALPEPAHPEKEQGKIYAASITGLDEKQVQELIRLWPQALIREVS